MRTYLEMSTLKVTRQISLMEGTWFVRVPVAAKLFTWMEYGLRGYSYHQQLLR